MSISGYIEKVGRDPSQDAIVLELCGTDDGTGYSPAGQPYLWIIRPTWEPPVGSTIWGSASSVEIQSLEGEKREYIRRGYTGIVEMDAFHGNLFWCGCGWIGNNLIQKGISPLSRCPSCDNASILVNPRKSL